MISDWKDCWKWFSVHVAIIIAALNAAMALLPSLQGLLTPGQYAVANATLGVAVIVARLVNQP
ncbi:MAG: hypothetical protein V1784_03760 [bacterium]